jgi:predicted DNA-binding transcriptional regulator AlpA
MNGFSNNPSHVNERQPALLVKAAEVARLMGISTRSLWRLVRAQQFPRPVRVGHCSRWRLADVEAWVNRCDTPHSNPMEMPNVNTPPSG